MAEDVSDYTNRC